MINESIKNQIKKVLNRAENKGYDLNKITYKINSIGNIIMTIPRIYHKGVMNFTIFKDGSIAGGFFNETDLKPIEIKF